MNCVQRRIFQAFVKSGGDPNNSAQYAALWRYFQALVVTLPNKAGRVVDFMPRGDERMTYARAAAQLGISEAAARLYGWHGGRVLEEAIRRQQRKSPVTNRAAAPRGQGIGGEIMQQRKRNEADGATDGINHAMRRFWTTFTQCGGDFRNAAQVDELTGVVQNRKVTLPPRQRWAFELVSAAAGAHPYPQIVAGLQRQGIQVNEQTLRRLVQRAIEKIEDDIRRRPWGQKTPRESGGSPPPRTRRRGER